MYDINMKNVKKGKNFYYIFLTFTLFFLIIFSSIIVFNFIESNSMDSETMSVNVEVKSYFDDEGTTMYTPIYYYIVEGEQYSCSNYSSNRSPGKENKTVYYDSNNPANCMTDSSKSMKYMLLPFMIIPIVFIIIALTGIKKVNKRIRKIKELNQKGKLIKNLPYYLQDTGTVINGVPIQRPVIDYKLPSGLNIELYGDPRNDRKHYDSDGMMDLLIDESDSDNYYIDFEINRLTGNLPQDYSNYSQQINQSNQNGYPQQMKQMDQYGQTTQVNPTSQNGQPQQMKQMDQYGQTTQVNPTSQNGQPQQMKPMDQYGQTTQVNPTSQNGYPQQNNQDINNNN